MAAIAVLYAGEDNAFVENRLLPTLPPLGFERWISLDGDSALEQALDRNMTILVIVSATSARAKWVRDRVDKSSGSDDLLIVIRIDETAPADVARGLASKPTIDLRAEEADVRLRSNLAELLPLPSTAETFALPTAGRDIDWNATVFSQYLSESLLRHDDDRAAALIGVLGAQIRRRRVPYGAENATRDLDVLRKKRQFGLMQQYAEIVVASGEDDLRMRRQYGQALIELKQFPRALEVLQQVVIDASTTHEESYEARGLIGRIYKQRYVDGGDNGSRELLVRAIEAYESVFNDDASKAWHAVNASSLRRRASRDGHEIADPERARTIARVVLERLRPDAEDVWDRACVVEALLAVDAYEDADKALDFYLEHEGLDSFEVSSTYRQFDEVLELEKDSRGAAILGRLWASVRRHRAGGVATTSADTAPALSSFLLRVSDPTWTPPNLPDLAIYARLGRILSISASEETIKKLLKDPIVIGAERSRPQNSLDCERSIPFIRAPRCLPALAGTSSENGSHALIAIVDDGIDVLHESFLDSAGQSRIVGIWHQRDRSGPPPIGFTFGTYYDSQAIQRFVQQGAAPATLGRNRDGHGTHVASIAAGRPCGTFSGGVACDARILVVITASNEPIGYSTAHVAALHFIDQTARALNLPVVVNVSQGMNAGAHDGKSALEIAFDEFTSGGRARGRAVVKSAGNEGDKNGHAFHNIGSNGGAHFRWNWQPTPMSRKEHIELWYRRGLGLRARLHAPTPNGSTPLVSDWVDLKRQDLSGTLAGVTFRLQLVHLHIDQGDSQLAVDLEAALTTRPGEWAIEVVGGRFFGTGDIHAWIERHDGPPSSFTNHAMPEMTLSIPGTANSVITVAAVDAAMPLVAGPFSSSGPTRDRREHQKPDVCAPGVGVNAARGGTLCDAIAMSGTSMAAPHVTGAIALVFSKCGRNGTDIPASTQVGAVLRDTTQNFNGQWTQSQGWGLIDVQALLEAF